MKACRRDSNPRRRARRRLVRRRRARRRPRVRPCRFRAFWFRPTDRRCSAARTDAAIGPTSFFFFTFFFFFSVQSIGSRRARRWQESRGERGVSVAERLSCERNKLLRALRFVSDPLGRRRRSWLLVCATFLSHLTRPSGCSFGASPCFPRLRLPLTCRSFFFFFFPCV